MSYDIDVLVDGKVVQLEKRNVLQGGTYAIGGTHDASFNITYNYAPHFVRVFGENGIRSLYGRKVIDSLPLIVDALQKLGNDTHENYWEPTEGNAKLALIQLHILGVQVLIEGHTDAVWNGD